MDSARPPRKHHFAPVFHLTEWTGVDGELEQFHRPYGPEVKIRRLPPTATGFRENLYAMPGLPPDLEQQVESRFMQHVDDLAAVELARMKAGGLPSTSEQRTAWTRYLQSLLLRTPADIAGIKARTRIDWGVTIPKIQETYESLKRNGDPATFEEFMTRDDPEMIERVAMKLATVLIDNPGMGVFINNMKWDVLDLAGADHALLTSDLGPEQILGLGDSRAFITLPLTPTLLFIAARTADSIANLRRHSPRRLVRARNASAVKMARDYVWATDRSQEKFIRRHYGSVLAPRLGERLAETAGGT